MKEMTFQECSRIVSESLSNERDIVFSYIERTVVKISKIKITDQEIRKRNPIKDKHLDFFIRDMLIRKIRIKVCRDTLLILNSQLHVSKGNVKQIRQWILDMIITNKEIIQQRKQMIAYLLSKRKKK